MPVNKYFKGHGDEVMSAMAKEYGPKKGKSVFYATANKKSDKPSVDSSPSFKLKKKFGVK